MISCLGPDQMIYFASLLGDIVTIHGAWDLVVIEAETRTTVWERTNGLLCRTDTPSVD